MSRTPLHGINGSNPLGFMAALGLLRVASERFPGARLAFADDGSFCADLENVDGDIVELVVADATQASEQAAWRLTYEKEEKKGTKVVADLKPPPEVFKRFLDSQIVAWKAGNPEGAAYAAAYATSVVTDNNGNTKPTAFHFTAANQEFLKAVDTSRSLLDSQWVHDSLLVGHAARTGSNLRWDPAAERNWALMASNPTTEGTSVDAPLEWLAFRSLPFFPSFPRDAFPKPRVATTAVSGRGDEMRFVWPLWRLPASRETVRSLLQAEWDDDDAERPESGVFAVCSSDIRRTSQGFGNFGPPIVRT